MDAIAKMAKEMGSFRSQGSISETAKSVIPVSNADPSIHLEDHDFEGESPLDSIASKRKSKNV